MTDFYEGIADVLTRTLKEATADIERLRRINAQLLKDLNAVPVEMWELQEKVTSLELQVKSLGGTPVTSHDGDLGALRMNVDATVDALIHELLSGNRTAENRLRQLATEALSARPEGGDIAKDAARYRWYRENWGVEYDGPNSLKLYTLINSRFRRGLSEPQGFDAAIDGAIAGSSHPPQSRSQEPKGDR
jgi:hypothetical protein